MSEGMIKRYLQRSLLRLFHRWDDVSGRYVDANADGHGSEGDDARPADAVDALVDDGGSGRAVELAGAGLPLLGAARQEDRGTTTKRGDDGAAARSASIRRRLDDKDLLLAEGAAAEFSAFTALCSTIAGLFAPLSWIVVAGLYGLSSVEPLTRVLQGVHLLLNAGITAVVLMRVQAGGEVLNLHGAPSHTGAPIYDAEFLMPLVFATFMHFAVGMVNGFPVLSEWARQALNGIRTMWKAEDAGSGRCCRARGARAAREFALTYRIAHEALYRPTRKAVWRLRDRLRRTGIKLPVFVAHPHGYKPVLAAVVPVKETVGGDPELTLRTQAHAKDPLLRGCDGDPGSYRAQVAAADFLIPGARAAVVDGVEEGDLPNGGLVEVTLDAVADQVVFGLHDGSGGLIAMVCERGGAWIVNFYTFIGLGLTIFAPLIFRYYMDCEYWCRLDGSSWATLIVIEAVTFEAHSVLLRVLTSCIGTYADLLRALRQLSRMLRREAADKAQLPRLDFNEYDHLVAWVALRDHVFAHFAPYLSVAETFVALYVSSFIVWIASLAYEFTKHSSSGSGNDGGGDGVDNREVAAMIFLGSMVVAEASCFIVCIIILGALANSERRKHMTALSAAEVQLQVVARMTNVHSLDSYGPQVSLLASVNRMLQGRAQTVRFLGLTLTPAILTGLAAPLSALATSVLPVLYANVIQTEAEWGCSSPNSCLNTAVNGTSVL